MSLINKPPITKCCLVLYDSVPDVLRAYLDLDSDKITVDSMFQSCPKIYGVAKQIWTSNQE